MSPNEPSSLRVTWQTTASVDSYHTREMPPNTGKLICLRGAGHRASKPPKSKLVTEDHES
jgi:hypothetical protein